MTPTVYIVVGPTAVGKTKYAIDLAQQLQTEIISADARQCYQELNIGVARPSNEELAQVKHHFIASHSIQDTVNAGVFEQYAFAKANELLTKFGAAVMVGGTGLYIKAFVEGMDQIPEMDVDGQPKTNNTGTEFSDVRWQRIERETFDFNTLFTYDDADFGVNLDAIRQEIAEKGYWT